MAQLAPTQLMDYENADRRRHPAIYCEAPSSHQLGSLNNLDYIYLNILRASADRSRFVELEQTYTQLRDELSKMRAQRAGWDGYDAPSPNDAAIEASEQALTVLRSENAKPTAILLSADGGVGICFVEQDRYAHMEFSNSGEVWVLMYGPHGDPETGQLPSSDAASIREGWTRIRAYLQS